MSLRIAIRRTTQSLRRFSQTRSSSIRVLLSTSQRNPTHTTSAGSVFPASQRFYSDMASSNPTEFVENAINSNPVVLFSKSWCPYCTKVKKLFDSIGVKPTVFELDQMANGDDIQKALQAKSGQRTVPNIYIGQTHVGGSDDTHAAKSNGKLKKLLTDAGINDAKL